MYEWLASGRTELSLSYLCFKRMFHKEFSWRCVAQWTNEWAGQERGKGYLMQESECCLLMNASCFNHWAAVELKEESTTFAAELCLSHDAYVKCRCALVESRSLFLNGMYLYGSLNWWIWDLEDLSLWSDTNIYSRSEFAFTCLPEMKCLFVLPFLSAVVDILWHFYGSIKHEGYASDMNDNSKH